MFYSKCSQTQTKVKLLSDLLINLPSQTNWRATPGDRLDIPVGGVVLDSRLINPGDLFVALVGGSTDGHRYIPMAIQRGAMAVVGEKPLTGLSVPYIQVSDSRLAFAHLASAYFDFPARKLTVIGVTGTDGKTTTSNLIHSILRAAGLDAGMISTVNAIIGSLELDTGFHVTTPEASDVQRFLAQMVSAGLSHVVLEATSHGLAQNRVAGCDFDAGVVTNITHEHLDYHGSYESYRAAKARLFDLVASKPAKGLPDLRLAVLNREDGSYRYLINHIHSLEETTRSSIKIVSYGLSAEADVCASNITPGEDNIRFTVAGPGFDLPIECKLLGEYNVLNCLAAIAVTVAGLGIDPQSAREGIRSLESVPGRMERMDLGTGFLTYVDFAHTPNALRSALSHIRNVVRKGDPRGRVIAVFGSAGLRDRLKRHMMAEASVELADITVLTAEDPRTESLEDILAEMAAACESRGGVEGTTFWRVPDRGEAIRLAFSLSRQGDAVVVLGKGHEQSMCFGEIEYPWDDRVAVRAAAAEYLGLPGPTMPYLPTKK